MHPYRTQATKTAEPAELKDARREIDPLAPLLLAAGGTLVVSAALFSDGAAVALGALLVLAAARRGAMS